MNGECINIMTITLTENAAKHIQQQLSKQRSGIALRVGIKKSGCSGYSYTFDLSDEIKKDDHLFSSNEAQVVVNAKDLPFLNGSRIDFVQEGVNSFFKFDNPNIDNSCGCGESFNVKES